MNLDLNGRKKLLLTAILIAFTGTLMLQASLTSSNPGQVSSNQAITHVEEKISLSPELNAEEQEWREKLFSDSDRERVIVRLEEDSGEEMRTQAINTLDAESIRHTFSSFNGFSATINEEEFDRLKENPDIESIRRVGVKKLFLQDSTEIVNAISTWNIQDAEGRDLTGKGKSACVIDTGVDYTHPDLGGCTEEEFLNGNCEKVIDGYDIVEDEKNQTDEDGHGTHAAGIVAANGSNIKGVAPEANIVAIDAYNETLNGFNDDDLISAIEWCANNASNLNISVISMSLGGGLYNDYCDNESLPEQFVPSINNAVGKNITVSVVTGNDNNKTHISSPACIENATRVGATNKDDTIA
ncbi:MAG: S8 family serine peptidase, partial [archaeon]